MATSNIAMNLTGNALSQLQKVQTQLGKVKSQVDKTAGSFANLNGLLSRLAIGAFIFNTIRAADATEELAKATGLSIAAIDGLNKAFIANGGDAEAATTAITKLSNEIQDASQGGLAAQANFSRVGVSLQDLQNLSEQDVLRKTIEGLSKLPIGAERTAISMALLGKQVRTVDFEGVNQDLDKFIEKSKEAEPGIQEAAKLFGNLQNAGKAFGTELTNQFQPLLASLNKLAENTDVIAKNLAELVRIVTILGAAFLIFSRVLPLLTKVGDGIKGLGSAATFLGKNFRSIRQNVIGFFLNLGAAIGVVTGRAGGLKSALFALLNVVRILARSLGILGIIWGIAEAINYLGKVLFDKDLFGWLAEKFEWATEKAKEFLRTLKLIDEPKRTGATGSWEGPDPMRPDEGAGTETEDALKSFRNNIKDITQAYSDQNDERLKSLNLERLYLGMTENEVEVQKAVGEVIADNEKAIQDLINKRASLSADEKQLGGAALIDQEISKLRERLEADKAATAEAVRGLQARRAETEQLLHLNNMVRDSITNAEAITQLQEELSLVGLYGDELEKQSELLNIERQLRNELQTIAIDLLDLKAKEATMNADEFQREIERHQERIRMAYELRDAQVTAATQSRDKRNEVEQSYSEGVRRGLEDMAKDMTPVKIAQKAVENGFDKMNSALDDFVETGKLNFADLARSVILDLTKMIAKALIFQAIKTALGAMGLGIPGMAKGGTVGQNKPYIVGEAGPELFIPRSAGQIVPNNELGGGQVVSQPVTNNNVVYNISAIDSKSVAQFFYENRKAMLGTVTMARKEMPYATA